MLDYGGTNVFAAPSQAKLLTENEVRVLANSIDIEEQYERAKAGISDLPITQEIADACQAYVTDENGKTESIPVAVTIKKLGQVQRAGQQRNVYTLTAFASDTKTEYNTSQTLETTANVSLTWIDNLGIENELVSVSGGWSPGNNNQLTDRSVRYGADNDDDRSTTRFPSGNSFSYDGTSSMVGFMLYVDSTVYVYGRALRCRVVSSILS